MIGQDQAFCLQPQKVPEEKISEVSKKSDQSYYIKYAPEISAKFFILPNVVRKSVGTVTIL